MRAHPPTAQSALHRDVFMWQAVQLASSNPQRPFAAVIVDRETGMIAASGINRVQDNPLWHAEVVAIDRLADSTFSNVESLSMYSTAEPCPMCFSAILWTGISEVVYGTSISRLEELGWRQIPIDVEEISSRSPGFSCTIHGGVLREETDLLFEAKKNSSGGARNSL